MKTASIAFNTFRESLRDKIMIGVLVFTFVIILSNIVTVQLTVGQWMRLTVDVGLGAITVFGILLAIFLGITLISREIERKTIYTVVSKPIHRHQFLLGKYLGLISTIFANAGLMLLVLYGVLLYLNPQEGVPYLGIFMAWLLMLLEFMVVAAIATFFSTFSPAVLAAMFTIGFWVIGHLISDIGYWGLKSGDESVVAMAKTLYYAMPNLELFNVRNKVTYRIAVEWRYVGWVTTYALLYIVFILGSATVIFSRRDFK
jgi:ABC-type transport system involved in multi-copper enzyme maturation permease subunit